MTEQETPRRCVLFPKRYYVALAGTLAMFIPGSNMKCFAMVLTHVTATNSSNTDNLVFTNCTAFNSSRDIRIAISKHTMFLLYSMYSVGFPMLRPLLAVQAHRWSPVRLLAILLVVSNIITISLPFILRFSVPVLFVSRWVQGALDGALCPCAVGIVTSWLIEEEKGRLFGMTFAGLNLAPAVNSLLATFTLCYVSWDSVLFIVGGVGISFGVLIIVTIYDTPEKHPSLTASEVQLYQRQRTTVLLSGEKERGPIPWRRILTSPSVWAAFLGYFSRTFCYIILLVGEPQYFMDAFNINIADIGLLATLPHIGLSVFCFLGGVLADLLFRWGLTRTATRKLLFSIGRLTEGLCLLNLYFVSNWSHAVTLLTVGVSIGGISEVGYLALPADMAPKYVTVISGVAATGCIGGFIANMSVSAICAQYKGMAIWHRVFLMSGSISCSAVFIFVLTASAEVQTWAKETCSSETCNTEQSELDRLLPDKPSDGGDLQTGDSEF